MVFNIKQMATPNPSKFSYEEMVEAIDKRVDKLYLPKVGYITDLDVDKVRINKDAYPGFFCDMAAGNTRASATHISSHIAREQLKRIYKRKTVSLNV